MRAPSRASPPRVAECAFPNEAAQEAIQRIISTGWRRSADRTGLRAISLQTGNFTGKLPISSAWRPGKPSETSATKVVWTQFPNPANWEIFWANRVAHRPSRDLKTIVSKYLANERAWRAVIRWQDPIALDDVREGNSTLIS